MDDLNQPELIAQLQYLLDNKTKPIGSLGFLESLGQQMGLIQGTLFPELLHPQMVVFAGDHGLAAKGVSAYPSDVTWQMVENFLTGGAAISVLARQHGLALTVVDAGVAKHLPPRNGLQIRKIALGTADSSEGPAMTAAQCQAALEAGADVIKGLPGNVVLLGEMGIGNTSSAALIMARITNTPLERCIGRGTGLDDAGMQRKLTVLQQALSLHADAVTPLHILAAVGGFEIAMMVGAALEAAKQNRTVVIDGFIASSAILIASALQPLVLQRCIFAHQSNEQAHAQMLNYMNAKPVLNLGLRLGEGSGAALAWPLLVSSCRILREMASFKSASVSNAVSPALLISKGEGAQI